MSSTVIPGHDEPPIREIVSHPTPEEKQSLRNCSLVVKSWIHPSQRLLFEKVEIEYPKAEVEPAHCALRDYFLSANTPHLTLRTHLVPTSPHRAILHFPALALSDCNGGLKALSNRHALDLVQFTKEIRILQGIFGKSNWFSPNFSVMEFASLLRIDERAQPCGSVLGHHFTNSGT